MKSSDYVALVLAGGQGKRLGVLTNEIAKPAIPFGGKYRLIDFTLSNCRHSKIGNVGVVTQYCERELANYIGTGSHWLPDERGACIITLPPREKNGLLEFYKGTANAVLDNADFIEHYNARNVLVLSGDHIYKMDYTKMLEAHEKSGAAVTIAATNVPLAEASRFGIMATDERSIITYFEEKPKRPKNTLASMGVYVFDWAILLRYLYKYNTDYQTGMDIGRDIIPNMLERGEKLAAYVFDGYWRDVGTIYSLWEANMELLSSPPAISLGDENWEIISRDKTALHLYTHPASDDDFNVNSLVSRDCVNKGTIISSVISSDVEIGEDANIFNSVIMPGARIGRGACVIRAIIGPNTVVDEYTAIGGVKPDGKYLDNCQGISVVCNNSNYRRSSERWDFAAVSQLEAVCAV